MTVSGPNIKVWCQAAAVHPGLTWLRGLPAAACRPRPTPASTGAAAAKANVGPGLYPGVGQSVSQQKLTGEVVSPWSSYLTGLVGETSLLRPGRLVEEPCQFYLKSTEIVYKCGCRWNLEPGSWIDWTTTFYNVSLREHCCGDVHNCPRLNVRQSHGNSTTLEAMALHCSQNK